MGLVAIVNRTLNHREAIPTVLAFAFLGLLLAKLTSAGVASVLQVRFVEDTVRTLYDRLCHGVANAPFRHLERVGIPRILTVLTADVPTLGAVVQSLPSLLINGAVLVPTYRDAHDRAALEVIRVAFPGREVIGIDCLPLILQHGSLHCVTMQIPKGVLP